ncbi:MAG: RDD family protein [Actinomycetota bacterium]|nr:RDD family protein [Actinomycetota bacterium]
MSFSSSEAHGRLNPYVTFGTTPAGFWRRVFSTLVDELAVFVIVIAIAKIIAPGISITGATTGAAFYHAAFVFTSLMVVVYTAYEVILIGRRPGRTLGCYVAGIQVVSTLMDTPGYSRSSKRVALYLASEVLGFTPVPGLGQLLFLVDNLWMLIDRDRQTLHDKIADTYVIVHRRGLAPETPEGL